MEEQARLRTNAEKLRAVYDSFEGNFPVSTLFALLPTRTYTP
jgi:hypothetical protein